MRKTHQTFDKIELWAMWLTIKGIMLNSNYEKCVWHYSIKRFFSGVHVLCKLCRWTHKLNKSPKDVYIKFVSASAQFTHAWTPEKNRLILIIPQYNTESKNVFLHIPGLKIAQIKIPRNLVDDINSMTLYDDFQLT